MKSRVNPIFSLALLFLASLTFYNCTQTQAPVDVKSEIQEANNGFMDAFNSGDATGVAAHYTTDGRVLPPNGDAVEGTEDLEAFWKGVIESGLKVTLKTVTAVDYGGVAVEEGRYQLHAGDQEVDQGKYLVEWKMVDGQWKLNKDMFNTSNPPPPPPEPMESDTTAAE